MQLASILSMSCNIQHLAQQQWQREIKWSMLRKRYFLHFRRAGKVNRQRGLLNHIIKWITERVAWRPKESEPLGHCVAWDPKRRLRRRNDEKRTSQPIKSKTNELRIMLREKPLGQESELKTQRQRFSKSRKIWSMVKSLDWQTESLKSVLRKWLLLSETVWVMLQVPTMGRMGKMEMMKRQSRANWAKMTNPAGWWALSPTQYSSIWRGFGRSRWSLPSWHNRDVKMQLATSVKEMRCTPHLNWAFRLSFNPKWVMTLRHLHRQQLQYIWGVLRLSLEYCECCKWLLDQEIVKSS